MLLQVNTLLQWQVAEGKPPVERVLWIDEARTRLWAINVNDKKAWPVYHLYEDIEIALVNGRASILQNFYKYFVKLLPDDEYLQKHNTRAKKNYALIAPLVENDDQRIYWPEYRGQMVAELAVKLACRKGQIYSNLRRYWQGGCVPNATLPNYHRCGMINDRQDHGKKRGRPSGGGKNLTDNDRHKFRRSINEYKKAGIKKKLPDVWEHIKETHFNTGYEELKDGTQVPILPPANSLPSYAQFKDFYYKNRNPKKDIIVFDGEKEFERNNRQTLGNETLKAFGPGSVYEIDASIGDIYLRCYLKRKLIIGRPVIYLVVDVFSRMIVGFAITLEGPSWAGAKLALENAFSDKVAFCKQFGVEITEAEWPVKGKCETLIGDNGEIAGYDANSLVDPLGIRVSNTPTERPDLKGIIESRFPIIKRIAIDWVPGAIRPTRKRRGKDYRLDALLDLNQFRKLMIECILYYNKSHWFDRYRMSTHMIADNVEPIPIKMWNWGMLKLTGQLRLEDPEVISMNLLPRDKATVTSEGIRFRGVHYVCERALQEQWFLRLKGKRSKRVDIVYESLVDRIYLRIGHGKRFEECVLTAADERFKGLDWYELLEYFSLKKQASKAFRTEEQQSAATYHARAERILTDARKMNDLALADDNRSNKARTQGIRESRQYLKKYERKKGVGSSAIRNTSNKLATVIPIKGSKKSKESKADRGYIPPAQPYDELRKAREEAKKRGKQWS